MQTVRANNQLGGYPLSIRQQYRCSSYVHGLHSNTGTHIYTAIERYLHQLLMQLRL